MQESIKNPLLQILNNKVGSSYTVLELQEMCELLPTEYTVDKLQLSHTLQKLQEEGLISIKYLDSENCCLNLLPMGREQAAKMLKTNANTNTTFDLPVVDSMQEKKQELQVHNKKVKNWIMQFSASFSGGFLAGLITLIVVLCTR